jgi:hypothetical protein
LTKKIGIKTKRKVCTFYSAKDIKKASKIILPNTSYLIETAKGDIIRLLANN